MTDHLKQLLDEGHFDEAWHRLLIEARDAADFHVVQSLCRVRQKLVARAPAPAQPVQLRIALLSGATTTLLERPLGLALESVGVSSMIHASPYNTYAREMLDGGSATVAFKPDVAVVVTSPANLPAWPSWRASQQEVDDTVTEVCDYWLDLCHALHDLVPCEIVLSNFHQLPLRPLGAAGVKVAGEANRFIRAVNDALARRAPAYVHIHDVESLAAFHGLYRWVDRRFWYHAKQPVSFECLVPYVRGVAQLIGALFGRSAKCVVVDLDDTLWGGVVGDDGPDQLRLGEGEPLGEAFVAFQRYLRQLRERGVLLAVCSKNDESTAMSPFQSRQEMILRLEDFAAFHANWRSKAENLREIAAELNIGLEALVFVDNNPVEREQVRQVLPEVRVVELGDDPADYPVRLDRTGWLDVVGFSAEDGERANMYAANATRARHRASAGDYQAYLRSLDQRAAVSPFEERHLDRISQLTNKTNQFNLTTRRLSRSELSVLMTSPVHVTASVRLADRFGDNGLISVLAARGDGTGLWIDLWLMSCRVFDRGVEYLLCNHLVDRARDEDYRTLHGVYVPTDRNGIVKDLYASLGFERVGCIDGGDHWSLDVDAYAALEPAITVVGDYRFETRGAGDE